MHVLITGAGGFIGAQIVDAILERTDFANASISAFDQVFSKTWPSNRVQLVRGDIRDADARAQALAQKPNVVFHLAGILGGTTETQYSLAREVNVDATLSLFEALRNVNSPPRVVYSSSVAVFGPVEPDLPVTDETRPSPQMLYGAQKLMMEIALTNLSLRGEIDGLSLRLPGVIARPGADHRMKSAFLHRLFDAHRSGDHFTMPVSRDGTSWLISVPACVQALIHGALLPRGWKGGRGLSRYLPNEFRCGTWSTVLRNSFRRAVRT